MKIVLGAYKEDTSWARQYDPIIIRNGVDRPNIGREPAAYLWYIIKNYDTLEGMYFFLQGNPLDHCPNIHEELQNTEGEFRWFSNRKNFVCDLMARPHDNVNIKAFLEKCNIPIEDDTIVFNGCCLFMVTTEHIKRRPKSFYENMYNVLMENKRWEYAFERCVGIIFDKWI